MSNSTQRTKLRKQLLANGYRPLPLLDKGIRIKGWSTATIDAAWLKQYERNGKFQNTGIRCDGLVAFDIDVYDEELADECEVIIETLCGKTELCRVGQWPKRLLLYRLDDEDMRSQRTGKYDGHQVELLTGSGRQFAAYGIHPGTEKPYDWLSEFGEDEVNPDPLNIPYDALQPLVCDQVIETMAAIENWFESLGLEKDSPGSTVGSSGVKLYDLTDGTMFEVEGVATSWFDLSATLTESGIWANAMRENGEYGDSDGVHCFISKGSQQPCAHDFPRDCTHYDEIISQDAIKLFPDPPATSVFTTTKTVLDDLLEHWVLMANKTARRISSPLREYALDGLKVFYKSETMPTPTQANANKQTPAMDLWLSDRRALKADYAQMRPDRPDEITIKAGQEIIFNTYRKPEHPASGGELDTLFEFIDHLIPTVTERDIFYDWHALKVANPGYRLHGLVMVTPTFGTGRGTWYQIVERLFGIEYVRSIEYDDIIGNTSQSTYNESFANSLVISVEEVYERIDGKSHWETRHVAYEKLKNICEPVARPTYIKRKYGRNSHEMVFASLLISSNHSDALAVPPGDRRLTIIDNGRVKLTQAPNDLYGRIEAWKDDPANIGALYRWLEARAAKGVVYDPLGDPPETPAKARMIDAGQSDIDRLYTLYCDQAKGDICVPYQWRMFAMNYAINCDYDLPIGSGLDRAITAIISKLACRIDGLPPTGIKMHGHPVRPWIIRNVAQWKGSADREKVRAEIDKNGPIIAGVIPLQPQ
jgi:hypothetical protein